MRDDLKKKIPGLVSLTAPHTLNVENKENKTKDKHNSTIDSKNPINSKEISKLRNYIVSKTPSVIDSTVFNVNKLAPENGTPDSKNWQNSPEVKEVKCIIFQVKKLKIHNTM